MDAAQKPLPTMPSSSDQHEKGLECEANRQDWYLVLCLGGLHAVVKMDVERHIRASGSSVHVQVFQEDCEGAQPLVQGVHDGQAGCGKLLLQTDASPATLRGMRCVQGLFALVAHASSLDIVLPAVPGNEPHRVPLENPTPSKSDHTPEIEAESESSPARVALAHIESLVTESLLWPGAVDVWKRFKDFEQSGPPDVRGGDSAKMEEPGTGLLDARNEHAGAEMPVVECDVKRLKFRASVVRDGSHPFNCVMASPRLGEAVWSANRGWTVDLQKYDVEVVAFILERGVVVGLSLGGDRTKRCSNGRVPKEDRGFIESGGRMSSLRPSTAYLMLQLAAPTAGDVVVDCMCGVGTLPFLGAGWFRDVFWMGGEIAADALEHVQRNVQSLRRSLAEPAGVIEAAGAAACAWDVQSLPLRDGTVDVMVVDMPFGFSCGTPKLNAKLYPTALAEMARVLRPGSGRAVLLVTRPYLLGLPNLQRARRKDDPLRSRQRGIPGRHGIDSKASGERREKCAESRENGGRSKCETVRSGLGCSEGPRAEGILPQGRESGKQGSCGVESDPSATGLATTETQGGAGALGEPGALWRIRAQHAVNVGGLFSWLLVLDRTGEPAPPERLDRRKGWVGLGLYRKRRKEQLRVGQGHGRGRHIGCADDD